MQNAWVQPDLRMGEKLDYVTSILEAVNLINATKEYLGLIIVKTEY